MPKFLMFERDNGYECVNVDQITETVRLPNGMALELTTGRSFDVSEYEVDAVLSELKATLIRSERAVDA